MYRSPDIRSKEPLLDRTALFRDWYRTEIPRLFRFVTYWIPDEAAAEDLTAAICERALHHLHQFDPQRGSLDRWMFGIARNVLRTDYRIRRQQPALIPLDALPEITSDGGSPEAQAEEAEMFREVLRHAAMLSPQEREAISLRYGAGYGNKDAAAVMGISANQVGVLIHRALSKLRQAMQEEEVQ